MKQYLELLKIIKEEGTYKPPAREGMPGTQSLFGYQFRHNLQDGFPLLTTKKIFWKGVVVELLWFLRGDTNIKYLVDNGVNIWNEDAYNYYVKLHSKLKYQGAGPHSFYNFIQLIKDADDFALGIYGKVVKEGYKLGDCGYQYGKVWRNWIGNEETPVGINGNIYVNKHIDQIANLIEGLKNNPESRRHIVTAWDPAHDQDLALTWCHAMFQFNCRPIDFMKRRELYYEHFGKELEGLVNYDLLESQNIPKYYLDCQLYQRSADVVLGVPFNIASYALLTHIICKIVNMIPGEFIHTFGDVHIYDNHKEAVEEQLSRTPTKLPELQIKPWDLHNISLDLDTIFNTMSIDNFQIHEYNPQPSIKAELSTGLKK